MTNNPELKNNLTNDEDNREDILPKDNFYQFRQNLQEASKIEPSDEEIKQKIIAERRIEKLNKKAEAREKTKRVAVAALSMAITAITLFEGFVATGPKSDFLKSEQARQKVIELENVKEVVFHGNIRSNPETTNSQDTNVYASTDEEISIAVQEGSTVYYYRNENDPNGSWYGVPTKLLEDESLISKSEARGDGDDYAWINTGNADVITE